jgi:hypothetical protein
MGGRFMPQLSPSTTLWGRSSRIQPTAAREDFRKRKSFGFQGGIKNPTGRPYPSSFLECDKINLLVSIALAAFSLTLRESKS